VSSTGTRVPDGLFSHEVESIIETALQLNKLVSLDIVEFNAKLGDPVHSIHHIKEVFKKALNSDQIKASL
jgi:arginase family enzyme